MEDWDRWLAAARTDEAARARRRRRVAAELHGLDADVATLLRDIVESGGTVDITTLDGDRIRGAVEAVTSDSVVVADRSLTVVPFRAVVCVQTESGQPTAARSGGSDVTLTSMLSALAEELTRVSVRVGGEDRIGRLVSVGDELMVLRLDGGRELRVVLGHLTAVRLVAPAW